PPDREEDDLLEIDPHVSVDNASMDENGTSRDEMDPEEERQSETSRDSREGMNPLVLLEQLEAALLAAIQSADKLLEEVGDDWLQDEEEPDMTWFYGPS